MSAGNVDEFMRVCRFATLRRSVRSLTLLRSVAKRQATATHSSPNVSATAGFVTLPALDVHALPPAPGSRATARSKPLFASCSTYGSVTLRQRVGARPADRARACSSRSNARRRRRCTSACCASSAGDVSTQPPWSMATSMMTARGGIRLQVLAADQVRRLAPGISTAPMTRSARRQAVEDVVPVAEQRRHVRRHHVVEVAQPVEVDVEDDDVGAEAGRDLGRVGADDAAAEDRRRWPAARPARRRAGCRGPRTAVRGTSPPPGCSSGPATSLIGVSSGSVPCGVAGSSRRRWR